MLTKANLELHEKCSRHVAEAKFLAGKKKREYLLLNRRVIALLCEHVFANASRDGYLWLLSSPLGVSLAHFYLQRYLLLLSERL